MRDPRRPRQAFPFRKQSKATAFKFERGHTLLVCRSVGEGLKPSEGLIMRLPNGLVAAVTGFATQAHLELLTFLQMHTFTL